MKANKKPAEDVAVSEHRPRLRKILLIIALAVAVGAFAYGLLSWLNPESGWQPIEADTRGELSLAGDFTLEYRLGLTGQGALAEKRAVTRLYSDALAECFRLFAPGAPADGETHGLSWLNAHPNEETVIPPALYQALERSLSAGRCLFMGPLTEMSDALHASVDDLEAAAYDPRLSDECAAFALEALGYIRDEEALGLELLGEGRVRLRVSPECLAFGADWGVGRWIDLHWLRNACAADVIAETLSAAGYPHFLLTSRDGFARLGPEARLSAAVPAWNAAGVREDLTQAAFTGPAAVACLRADCPGWGYVYSDGARRTCYLSLADGLDHCAADCLLATSATDGCLALGLALQPVMAGEEGVEGIQFEWMGAIEGKVIGNR